MSGPAAPAKYATPRNPANRTQGPACAAVSAGLGRPFMPWQRQVADTGLEMIPAAKPGTWRYRYRLVIVTVPRQAGKTALLQAVQIHRAVTRPGTGVWMTAQTGKDARKRWRDTLETLTARESPLRSVVKPYLSGGSERADFPNRSFIAPFAPVPKSLHGETPPLVSIDEAWAYDDEQGSALTAAIRPAQITIPDRQLWIVSTKGTVKSTFLNALIKQGRLSLDNPNTDIAFFEWSADEGLAAADPTSPETLAFHPAVGHTQTVADLQAEAEAEPNPANYRRGFLNLETVSEDTVLDLDRWDELGPAQDDDEPPALSESVLGFSVSRGRASAAIWQSWDTPDGVRIRHVADGPGVTWLPERLAQLRQLGARRFVTEDAGDTRTVTKTRAMTDLGLDLDQLTVRDYATACGLLLGRVKDGTIRHDGDELLRGQIEAAEARPMGGGVGFSEAHSRGPIDALKAATLASYATEQRTGIQLF